MRTWCVVGVLGWAGLTGCGPLRSETHARLDREGQALQGFVHSPAGLEFVSGTAWLPDVPARVLYRAPDRRYFTATQVQAMQPAEQDRLELREMDPEFYYYTKYGSPLAYARPLDLLDWETLAGRRVLDFGYGGVGHLRLMAVRGAEVVGVDVDPQLQALYSAPGDQGVIPGPNGQRGRLRLIHGRYPADARVAAAVDHGYDLIVSKNVLKRGYIHPEREVDPRMLVDLGVDDRTFVAALYDALRPGGHVMIYNLSPAPNRPDAPYRPWADGRCPFDRALLQAAGFDVLAYELDDTPAAREMARLLHWNSGEDPMDVDHGLFAQYTLLRRPDIQNHNSVE